MPDLTLIEDGSDVFTIAEFIGLMDCGAITDDDGTGYYGTATHVSEQLVSLDSVHKEQIYTHIVWYNK